MIFLLYSTDVQAINEVDACLEAVRSLKEGGGCSRTEVLLSSVTRLHINLTGIEHKYGHVAGAGLPSVIELPSEPQSAPELYVRCLRAIL